MGGKGILFCLLVHKYEKRLRRLILTLLFLIYRSFDELEAEMLQGQKLQVHMEVNDYFFFFTVNVHTKDFISPDAISLAKTLAYFTVSEHIAQLKLKIQIPSSILLCLERSRKTHSIT